METKTVAVILDYCGGRKTDTLYETLAESNKDFDIQVLDNASPRDVSRYVTVANPQNSFIGGGICDCLDLAERKGAEFLFYVSNDIELIRTPSIKHFEALAVSDESIVLVGVSLTNDSYQASRYPWMVDNGGDPDRIVPHYDPVCCLIRISFVRAFGGFPRSLGGWGYDWEFASYARFRGRKILVSNTALVRHIGDPSLSQEALGINFSKFTEMVRVYDDIYGDYRLLLAWHVAQEVPELRYQFGQHQQIEGSMHKRRLSDERILRLLEQTQSQLPFGLHRRV
jgi:hypothetical protein